MPHRSVVILVDQPQRGHALAAAAQPLAHCRITDASEPWLEPSAIQGVIADVPLDRTDIRHCLKTLAARLDGQPMPLIYLLRTTRGAELRLAEQLGATACFPALALPQIVVTGLFRQIAPDKTVTDLLVEHSFDRASDLFRNMLSASPVGQVDLAAVDTEIDPILHALHSAGLRRWLELLHAHDDTTVRHCLLVAGLVANLALHLGLSSAERAALVRAGLVHDVGKAQIPLAILNKPGPLDPEELAVMRTHAARGHAMLIASGMTDPISLMVTRHHHEMLDGSGYPDRLRSEAIPDAVRLITICDIYAALTEPRPYRPALRQDEALPILRRMAPDRLEDALVEVFARSLAMHESATAARKAQA